ncbi:MAG: cysteine desulfurase [Paludibacteraceae bacterium]|nr:cysteine desulfurase [Paludibacteraceae bacterium]OPZ03400.1 MAG: Cysteine desulfurase [Bacteroidetes bacterium ADurb.BinA395]MBP8967101.1 cysteine desulfurase [Paludibacteraceae bacterium]HOF98055.1 cysteine desulfurase [Paludibacteraceae bacterium]HOJ65403.1 cysteine desulfurase [Paludibacteraceae bacterium]
MNKEEIEHIRADFPILSEKVYNKDLIYFDNAATTQKPRCVVEKIEYAYFHLNANIHRGVHYLSLKATEAHEAARLTAAEFLHAEKKEEIIFTRGTTESINLVAFSFGEAFCHPGDEVIVSAMEHHSNIVPWQMLCERKGMKLRVIPVNENGELDMVAYSSLLNEKTRIVSVAHVSNVLGTINPVKEIIRIAHEKNIPVLIDGAQAVPHLSVDVRELDADFYVFSGHKIYGPTGIGILYGKEKWLNAIPPYQGGGEMISTVTFEKTTYNELPFKFEAGTPDYVGSTALAEALRYINNIGLDNIAAYENELLHYAEQQLMEIENMHIIGTAKNKCSVLSFLVDGIHPYDIGMLLDKLGIAVRTGHHCAQPIMDMFGIPGTVRASFAFYNTKEEIVRFTEALKKVVNMLK